MVWVHDSVCAGVWGGVYGMRHFLFGMDDFEDYVRERLAGKRGTEEGGFWYFLTAAVDGGGGGGD